eukprot:CAMPEP_0202447202 /NCGR_PEP_ID=MMETSP1360-20130828/5895_1 /ASSEMBLY_ACC=CAM_ASM_000848 /TAXON_ID=515479 /ORGANISM="Licmophora paradoxa, Strain CCMP2313" /LENGTH=212 /DNA_ID=CAMNT_0049064141 /DNA_START=182 /DNA_END=820 /DNA_ORIENTATION=-
MPAPACNSSSEHPYESISNYNRNTNNSIGPDGDLFHSKIGPSLLGKRASIQRRFDARSNAIGLLTCGGEGLAKHASFDPQYDRARDWIHNHPVGPAVLSPVLINGLVGALVEASLPQSVPMSNNMKHARPLVVGVEICARIEVVSVYPGGKEDCIENATSIASSALETTGEEYPGKTRGYSVGLKTEVIRVCDGVGIAEGTHNIWIPNYLHM